MINTNTYNSAGQRIAKTDAQGQATNYFYQGSVALYTTNASGAKTSFNLLGGSDNTIASKRYQGSQKDKYLSYNKDIRTSTSTLLNDSGTYTLSYDYSDFGETKRAGDSTITNEIAYTGGIYDTDTELYYLNARYYDPDDARFMTQDTYRGENTDPETLNLYGYCAGNPINYVDPSGHFLSSIAIPYPGIGPVSLPWFSSISNLNIPADVVLPPVVTQKPLKGGHRKNKRPSTKSKHEEGDSRRERDQRKTEKGDARRRFRRSGKTYLFTKRRLSRTSRRRAATRRRLRKFYKRAATLRKRRSSVSTRKYQYNRRSGGVQR